MKRPLIIAACLFLSGCAAFPFHGSRETVSGVRTADALSEAWPADAERFASQAALELSRRYPAGQTGLSLVTVPGQFGTSLENQLRGHGFAIFPLKLFFRPPDRLRPRRDYRRDHPYRVSSDPNLGRHGLQHDPQTHRRTPFHLSDSGASRSGLSSGRAGSGHTGGDASRAYSRTGSRSNGGTSPRSTADAGSPSTNAPQRGVVQCLRGFPDDADYHCRPDRDPRQMAVQHPGDGTAPEAGSIPEKYPMAKSSHGHGHGH